MSVDLLVMLSLAHVSSEKPKAGSLEKPLAFPCKRVYADSLCSDLGSKDTLRCYPIVAQKFRAQKFQAHCA